MLSSATAAVARNRGILNQAKPALPVWKNIKRVGYRKLYKIVRVDNAEDYADKAWESLARRVMDDDR